MKAVIFDLGSVIFDIDWEKINEEMVAKFGISSLIRSNYGPELNVVYDKAIRGENSMRDVFEKICEGKNLDVDEVLNYYKELYNKYKKPNQKLIELSKNLSKEMKVVCLTNTNDAHLQVHEEQGHLGDFDSVFASCQIGKIKEDEGGFDEVIKTLGFKPEELVFIDDNEKNIENAKSLGINAIKFENNEQLFGELNKFGINLK